MHKNNFIAAIQDTNGNTLRERGEEVRLPFGSEYKIYLKNQESRKARVTIDVNGKDALDGRAFIINPNSSTTVEGFMKDNVATHRFKFIQKTGQIVEHQGDNPEHGFIRVEVRFEKESPIRHEIHYEYVYRYRCLYCGCSPCICQRIPYTWCTNGTSTSGSSNIVAYNATHDNNVKSSTVNSSITRAIDKKSIKDYNRPHPDEGLTVHGSEINKTFQYTYIGELESNRTVFTFRMLGINDNGVTPIEKPVLTRIDIQCKTCGNQNPSTSKFCAKCGTSLTY